MKKLLLTVSAFFLFMIAGTNRAEACTGITLKTVNGGNVMARTIEWGGSNLNSVYVVVPKKYRQKSYAPDGGEGMEFEALYGYVGLSVEKEEFVAEGINQAGLSAGLFYFPNSGGYETFSPELRENTIADLQLVALVLSRCADVEEVKDLLGKVHVVGIDPRASTVHWRFADASGRQVVLEIIDGKVKFYENKLGVLTNSPDFDWQMKNLNNYVNLFAGTSDARDFGDVELSSFGAGSAMLGLPGDVTPPSRFVRAAFFQTTAPVLKTTDESVAQAFQILNNFDIPIGVEFKAGQTPTDIPSATQWTSASLPVEKKIYYRTMYNSTIRCIDLNTIDFGKVKYHAVPLDAERRQPVETITVK